VLVSALAYDGLPVVTADVMEPDPVIVEVVQDSNTKLITFPVVWLTSSSTAGVGPVDAVVRSAGRPGDAPTSHFPASPEVFLPLPGHQPSELPLLAGVVNTDGSHPVGPAEGLSLALGEAGAAKSPANQEVLTSKLVVGTMSSTTATTTTANIGWTTSTSPVASEPVDDVVKEAKLGG